jgi:hypothetical protein
MNRICPRLHNTVTSGQLVLWWLAGTLSWLGSGSCRCGSSCLAETDENADDRDHDQ